MSLQDLSKRESVQQAIDEFDALGQDAFLKKYGFGKSFKYLLSHNGRRYDSKAVLGAAHFYEFGQPLLHTEFSGGIAQTVKKLTELGFSVVSSGIDYSVLTSDDVHAVIDDFDRLGRDGFLQQYGGSGAQKFFIHLDGKEYDAKPVLVMAFRRHEMFAHIDSSDIDSTREGVADPLIKLGFEVTAKNDGVKMELGSLSATIQRVMELQDNYTPVLHSDDSQERLRLLGQITESFVDSASLTFESAFGQSFDLSGDFSLGAGNVPRVPWVRLYDPAISPSAQKGWYVVLLFAFDGRSCVLSLNQGTTAVVGSDKVLQITRRADQARQTLRNVSVKRQEHWPMSESTISLDDRGLGKSYEHGHVFGVRYERDAVPGDDQIVSDAEHLLEMLADLYEKDMGMSIIEDPATHVLLKWSSKQFPNNSTIGEHRRMLAENGMVVWAKFGKAIGDSRVESLQRQLDRSQVTHIYLKGGVPEEVFRATLSHVTQGTSGVDVTRIPSYYRDQLTGDETCFTLSSIETVDLLPTIDDVLYLESSPEKKLSESFAGQQSTYYVREKSPAGEAPSMSDEISPTEFDRLRELANTLNWDVDYTRDVVDGVRGDKRQMILTGPPGTGKTFVARAIANYLVEDNKDRVRLVQFHPSFGYEDFVEGLRPVALELGGFEFKRVPGAVVEMADAIIKDGEGRVLIIDEINRANISRVFGELMFLLEYRDETIRLMLDPRPFSLPDSLVMIGTMNTADRSIRSLDVAMRRRFKFYELLPDVKVLRRIYEKTSRRNLLGEGLFAGFESLNQRLEADIDRHHTIGHSFFVADVMNGSVLQSVWDHELLPLIEDYFFDQPEKVSEYSFDSFWPHD